jgi:hypothetical protein
MFCSQCGASNADDALFCQKCGKQLVAKASNEATLLSLPPTVPASPYGSHFSENGPYPSTEPNYPPAPPDVLYPYEQQPIPIDKINLTPDRDTQLAYNPFTEYRITDDEHIGRGRGVWIADEAKQYPRDIRFLDVQTDPRTCSFRAKKDDITIIEGPLLREPLGPGKYQATFKYKVHDVDVQTPEQHLLTMLVLSHVGGRVEEPDYYKYLAWRTLTTSDFTRTDEYKDFSLDFEVYSTMGGGEQSVEFCTVSLESGIRVTFDSVRLSQR